MFAQQENRAPSTFPDMKKKSKKKNSKSSSQKVRKNYKEEEMRIKMQAQVNSQIERQVRSKRIVAYTDLHVSDDSTSSGTIRSLLSGLAQGVAQGQRMLDTVWLRRIDVRLSCTTANADVYNLVRIGIFLFKMNSASVSPTMSSFYESALSIGPQAHMNFEGREYFRVLYDNEIPLSGTQTNPNDSSNVIVVRSINLSSTRVDFQLGTVMGTNIPYYVHYSDSTITPYPKIMAHFRVYYETE